MKDPYRIAIIQTLAYFELFEMPLNFFELLRYLYWPHRKEVEKTKLKEVLFSMVSAGEVITHEGHYFLEADIKERLGLRKVREKRAIAWLTKAKPWLKLLAAWPGVEMIAVCNNLALLHAKEDSDIDLFIVAQPGKIWQTRFFLAAFLQIFRKRTTPKSGDAEKFCLSFFVTSDALDLGSIKLEEQDMYLTYWLATLMPIYDPFDRLHDVFAKNHLLLQPVKRMKQEHACSYWSIDDTTIGFRLIELFTNQASWFPGWLERNTKSWQKKHFSEEIQQALKEKNSHVIVNDQMLKFHTNDRRQQFYDRWKKRCDALLN